MKNYKELEVWQKALDLTAEVYKLTCHFPDEERFGLTAQIRRAAVSNVAPALLLDGRLFDFRSLRLEESAHGDEDDWLDQDKP